MNIGEAAQASGVSAKMIRHYESVGLVETPPRNSLDEIRNLLSLWRDRGRASADVKALTLRHVADLEQRIAELAAMRDTLRELAQHCSGDERPDCPILADFAEVADAADAADAAQPQGTAACHG
ncbi:MerR family DNA-binding protein [Cupriavidus necator]|uniref:MerR family DNA-binding protein n=1 Tax=Cupriavidus necator TaxID=106590 RepID=UPI0039C222A4